jgi:hypothetical protein
VQPLSKLTLLPPSMEPSIVNGYGQDNLEFLRQASIKYDPEGLFQKGCVGGFKLGR